MICKLKSPYFHTLTLFNNSNRSNDYMSYCHDDEEDDDDDYGGDCYYSSDYDGHYYDDYNDDSDYSF